MAETENTKAYLLVYSTRLGTRDEVKACLNSMPKVLTWRTDLPSSFYIISPAETANELTDLIVECMGKRGRFIIVELGPSLTSVQGWLTGDTWKFLGRKFEKKQP